MTLHEELTARGFIHQTTAELPDIFNGEKRTIYHGIDPSADSAHAGNFVVWCLLRHLEQAGHKIVFLVGGATGRIGDPKPDAERTLLPESVIEQNIAVIKTQAERFFGSDANVTFVNNYDWFKTMNVLDFLRDVGKHFTVNELLKKDAIATRLESEIGLSYTEFAYPLIQGYDFLELHRQHGCDVQVGGSDQWGNIVAGVDLVRRKEQATVHAITVPLVTDKATGKKFGKSEGNAVWLDAGKTTPYQFYQFWLNVSDESVVDYLRLFTFLSLEEIETIEAEQKNNPGARPAQRALAAAVTESVHGAEAATAAVEVSGVLFGGSLEALSVAGTDLLLQTAPTYQVTGAESVVDVLVGSGLASSNREARTFIEGNAVSVCEEKVTAADVTLTTEQFVNNLALLRRGKKQLCVLVLR